MSLFQNGHRFSLAIRCRPPAGERLPVVAVEMAGASGEFVPVVGIVDTGASRTMLGFGTARALGIADPESSPVKPRTAFTATGQGFPYYVHPVMVQVSDTAGPAITFPLDAAFAAPTTRDLFGVDWLVHLCLAVDLQAVHFLRD